MQERIITSCKSWKMFCSELVEYKEVFLFLGWRDIIVHYKQTVIGVLWVLLRPLLTVAIFTVIFSKIAGIQSHTAPYALVVFSAMLAWQFFADCLTYGSNSFIGNEQLISKVYFPRIMLPASRLLCSLVDFSISFVCYFLIATLYYKQPLSFTVFLLPFYLVWLSVFSLSVSLFFGSLIVRYRDFRHLLPFIVQLGVYCTPVGFSFVMVPSQLRYLLALNPVSAIINGFRYALVAEPLYYGPQLLSLLVTIVMMALSIGYFKHAQEHFADLI